MPRKPRYTPPEQVVEVPATKAFHGLPLDAVLRAPPVLFAAGDVSLFDAPKRVAIVGAREASAAGVRRALKLATSLARAGVVVVSGLARGIDAAAHSAAFEAAGRTIAVIGTPLDRAYPAEHAAMQERIYAEHLLVSQFPIGSQVFPSNFIARNRTMAMLSHASVIVEASDTSGSLSQAAEMQRLGRPLFIMRSVLENKALTWPDKFLKAGASVLDETAQILEVFGR